MYKAMFTLQEAQKKRVCRVCGQRHDWPGPFGPALPFMLDFGAEFAHEACLAKCPTRRWKAQKLLTRLQVRMIVWKERAQVGYRDYVMTSVLLRKIERGRRILDRCQRVIRATNHLQAP